MHAAFARIAIAVLVLAGSCLAVAQPLASLRDDEGHPAVRGAPATRLVTLAPSLTELVFAAGGGDRLVGVSAYSDYPDEARRLPQVADGAGISWESLLALKPDLVLAWKSGTRPADIARLKGLGVNVFVIEIKQLTDVPRALRAIGALVGRVAPAESAAVQFLRQLTALRAANSRKPVVKTFFEISAKPLMTINHDHVISEMIRLCGGANVFDTAPSLVIEPSREELLARAPDAVLFGKSSNEMQRGDAPAYAGLTAVREGRIYAVTSDYAFRPGPRMLMAAGEICDALDRSRATAKENPKY